MERNFSFETASVKSVRMKLTWAQLDIVPSKVDEFQFIIAGDDDSMEELRVELSGDGLVVAQPQLAYAKEILPRRRWLQVCMRVPAGFGGDMDIDTISGTVGASSFSGGNLSMTTVSGGLSVRDVQGTLLWLHTVSGTISGTNLTAERSNLRSISGSITLRNVRLETTKLLTISGNVLLDLAPGARVLDMQSVSGALCVTTDDRVRAALHSLSGQFIIEEGLQVESGGLEVSASSVSGDLAVKKRSSGEAQ